MPRLELNPSSFSQESTEIREKLQERVVGQLEAVDALVSLMEKYRSNLYDHNRPIGSALFVGPTGVGKSEICDAFAYALHDDERTAIKIDCGEFQHSQDICKLTGSPPGYLGHRETPPRLKQETLNYYRTEKYPVTIVLLDEIEKASDALWHTMLGVLDKARLTMGDNTTTDFSQTIVLMTSNAGSGEIAHATGDRIGIHNQQEWTERSDEQLKKIATDAAKRKFTPEFINRLDKVVAFHTLSKEQIDLVLDKELARVYKQMFSQVKNPIAFVVTKAAKKQLVEEGYDRKYNGRHIRRTVEINVQTPLAKFIATGQADISSGVVIDHDGTSFKYWKES